MLNQVADLSAPDVDSFGKTDLDPGFDLLSAEHFFAVHAQGDFFSEESVLQRDVKRHSMRPFSSIPPLTGS